MNSIFMLMVAAAAIAAAPPPKGEGPPILDGAEPPRLTDVSYSFRCRDVKTRVTYRQEDIPPHRVPKLADALRVSLTQLSVSGRRLSPSGMTAASEVFRSFGWIERVSVSCYQGSVDVEVRGMPLRAWIDYIEKDLDERPRLSGRTIRIATSGAVAIVD